jgi:hypothetical protein
MKGFIAALVGATVVGGFVGGELTGGTFLLTGAVIGGVGVGAVLLGLGAYFEAQERRRKDETLPPEMRAVFDRMTGKGFPPSPRSTSTMAATRASPKAHAQHQQLLTPHSADLEEAGAMLHATMLELMADDAAAAARGETPQRRLIPHHAIKRDVIIAAYTKDFEASRRQMRTMNWTNAEKQRRLEEANRDFAKHLAGVNRLGPKELDEVIALMKRTRTDLLEIEQKVRATTSAYRIVEPL